MSKGRKIVFVLLLVGRVSVSVIVAKYNILPRTYDFEHAYVYWIWLRGSASYVIRADKPHLMLIEHKMNS